MTALAAMGEEGGLLDRRSQHLLTRLRVLLAAGQVQADLLLPTDLEE